MTQLPLATTATRRRLLLSSSRGGAWSHSHQPCGSAPEGRRNIVAKGMKRFEGIGKMAPPQPAIERLSPRVVSILGMNPSPFTLNGTNCYLVGTGRRRILIDAGEYPGFAPGSRLQHSHFLENLDSAMKQEGCVGLDMIIITHLHQDHYGGARGVQERWGPAPVAMLPVAPWSLELHTMKQLRDRGLLEIVRAGPSPFVDGKFTNLLVDKSGNVVAEADLPGWPDEDLSWDYAGRTKAEIQRDAWWCEMQEAWYRDWESGCREGGAPPACLELRHGQVIKTEGATLRVMHTPGHAQNHATLALDEERSLFSGDHVLGFGTTLVEDMYDYMASLEAMRRYSPARLYPGHGPFIADGADLLERYSRHRREREEQVEATLGVGRTMTASQLVAELYVNTSTDKWPQARANVEKILLKLRREGRARCFADASRAEPANLPQEGFVRRVGLDVAWALEDSGPDAGYPFEDFVAWIASGASDARSEASTGKPPARL